MLKRLIKLFLFFAKKFLFVLAQNSKTGPMQKTVCIVKTDAMGDFILFSEILPYFKKVYDGYKIILIGNYLWHELAEWVCKNKVVGNFGYEYFDEIFPVKEIPFHRNLLYYYNTLKKIRSFCPEIVIQPTFSRTRKGDELVLVFKEAEKIGYDGDLLNISLKLKYNNDKKYNKLIRNSGVSLETEKNKYFLDQLSSRKFNLPEGPEWKMSKKLLDEGKTFLKSIGFDLSRPIFIISPGAGYHIRCWPVENFICLIKDIYKYNSSGQFFLTGGKGDIGICEKIEKETKKMRVVNVCGKIKFSDLTKALALSNLFIGNESGSMHMALALDIPVVALAGGGHYKRYVTWKSGPNFFVKTNKMDCFNCDWKCIYKLEKDQPPPCIEKIKKEDVLKQIVKFLG